MNSFCKSVSFVLLIIQIYVIIYHIRITKTFLKDERAYRDIKTGKAQKQDWDGTLATQLNITIHISIAMLM